MGANIYKDGVQTALQHPIQKRIRLSFPRNGERKNARLYGWGNKSVGGISRRMRPLSSGHFEIKTDTPLP